MATTATLTGTFALPNDAAPDSAVLSVTLSAMDTDQNTRHVLPDDGSFTVALVSGAIPAGQEIWKNTAGLRGTHYRATLAWTASNGRLLSRYLGSFQVGDDASYDMADLLDQPPIASLPEGWYSTLTQGDYDAAITARDEAVAAALATAADRTAAALSAALSAAYAQTPEDTTVPGGAGYSALHYAAKAGADAAAADAAREMAEAAVANAQAAALTVATWTALAALTAAVAGTGAEVLDSDTGTHTDPVVGGTVNNAGRYSWSASPAGWRRIGDTGLSAKADKTTVQALDDRTTLADRVSVDTAARAGDPPSVQQPDWLSAMTRMTISRPRWRSTGRLPTGSTMRGVSTAMTERSGLFPTPLTIWRCPWSTGMGVP